MSRSRSGGSCFPFQTSPQTLRIRIIIYYHHIYYYLWRLRFLNKFPLLKSTQPLLSPQSNPVIHIPNVSKGFVSLRVTNLISNKRLLSTCQFYINKLESGFLNILQNSMYFIKAKMLTHLIVGRAVLRGHGDLLRPCPRRRLPDGVPPSAQ